MNNAELFLREHGAGHLEAVVQHPLNLDPLLNGLGEQYFRAMPYGMNSLAWLFWHITRVEDGCVSCVVAGTGQLFDQKWAERLHIPRQDVGTGMTKDEVADLSAQIDLPALWAYREAVGRRTRSLIPELWHSRWTQQLSEDDLRRGAEARVLSGDEHWLIGSSRVSLLFWWGLHHTLMHLGQVMMIKNMVGGKTS